MVNRHLLLGLNVIPHIKMRLTFQLAKKTNTPPKSPPPELEPPAPRLRHSTGNTRDSVAHNAPVPIPPPSLKPSRPSRELVLIHPFIRYLPVLLVVITWQKARHSQNTSTF